MKKVEHIGIAVKNIDEAEKLFGTLLNTKPYKRETVESDGVVTSFLRIGDTKIELLEGLFADSPVAKFIAKRGEGTHHIAFDVEDIVAEMARLKAEGFQLLSDKPYNGADNKLVCFIHPKTANGVLIELCQDKNSAVS